MTMAGMPPDPPTIACMQEVARHDRLPVRLLPALRLVEGGAPGMVNRNTNGTEDLGVMQINTSWIQPLARFTGWSPARVRDLLIFDPCFNIAAAGAILGTYRAEAKGDLLRAIGDYHSHTPGLHDAYLDKVLRAAQHILQSQQGPGAAVASYASSHPK